MPADLVERPASVLGTRGLVFANLMLIAASFTPWFMGTGAHPGFADRVTHSGNGFRWDVVWLFWSNVVLLIAFAICMTNRQNRAARLSGMLIAMEFFAMILYVLFALLPNLYMG
jgi:hypothetical protein